MAKKLTHITQYDGNSLDQLDFSQGMVGFENSAQEHPYPFLILRPEKRGKNLILKEEGIDFPDISQGMRLIHSPKKGEQQKWFLYTPMLGGDLAFWVPYTFGEKEDRSLILKPTIGSYKDILETSGKKHVYFPVEKAYAGRDQIIKALESKENNQMKIYASIIRNSI